MIHAVDDGAHCIPLETLGEEHIIQQVEERHCNRAIECLLEWDVLLLLLVVFLCKKK